MIRQKLTFLIGGLFAAFTSFAVLATNDVPNSSLSISTVIKILYAKGYTNIKKIEPDEGGGYGAELINRKDRRVRLHIDPNTEAITIVESVSGIQSKLKPVKFSMYDVTKKIEKAGYHNINIIELKGNNYEIRVFDKKNKEVNLKVNGNTGQIIYHYVKH